MSAATVPVAVAAPSCLFFNRGGQSIAWDGVSVTFDPLFTDPVVCSLEKLPPHFGDGYNASCGKEGSVTFTAGSSRPGAEEADIVVFNNIFFWLKCAKDGA